MGLIQDYAEVDNVENVVLFISDALRYDRLPSSISELGITATTIAASTCTNSSLPSLTSGCYPSTHGIWSIYDQSFDSKPALIDFENFGYNAETSWVTLKPKEKPPLTVHGLTESHDLSELSTPFVYIEHDKGPHAPYNELHSDLSDKEFYNRYVERFNEIPEMYDDLVSGSCERFFDVYNSLQERDLLEKTLIVFTSDHGELLGESKYGNMFGHGHPLIPEMIYVPTVFTGAGIDKKIHLDVPLSSTDLAPTMVGSQGRDYNEDVDGIDLWNNYPESYRYPRTEAKYTLKNFPIYKANAVFDGDGGYVYNYPSSVHSYGLWLINQYFNSPSAIVRRKNFSIGALRKIWKCYKPGVVKYGNPELSKKQAKSFLHETGP